MRLSGAVALIAGASRGIGSAVAQGFASEGASVFLVGHRDQEALEHAIQETRKASIPVGSAEVVGGFSMLGATRRSVGSPTR